MSRPARLVGCVGTRHTQELRTASVACPGDGDQCRKSLQPFVSVSRDRQAGASSNDVFAQKDWSSKEGGDRQVLFIGRAGWLLGRPPPRLATAL
jgi:hypothetical protein